MSLTQLHLVPAQDIAMSCAIGEVLPLDDPQLAVSGWGLLGDRLFIALPARTIIVARDTGVILDIIDSDGMTLLGVDEDGQLAIFSDDLSWNYQVYPFDARAWMDNDDPDFPRFVLEEDGDIAWLIDMDTNIRYHIQELVPVSAAPSRDALPA